MLSYFPTNCEVQIIRTSGDLDIWGNSGEVQSEAYRARLVFNSEERTSTIEGGHEIKCEATIYFIGAVHLTLNDEVSFIDYLGNTRILKLKSIQYKADLSGKVIYTKVVV